METTDMKFQIEPAGPCRKRVSVQIPGERVSAEFERSYKNWIRTVPIPGFRPGKAPRKLVEKRFGEQVSVEVRQTLLDAAFEEALDKNQIKPIATPQLESDEIEVAPGAEVKFDFTVTVKPEFDLPDLKDITVAVPSGEPTDEEITSAFDELRKRKATLRPAPDSGKDATIREGDVVTMKLVGTAGGETRLSEDGLEYEVGSAWLGGLIVDGLDNKLVGKKAGVTAEATASAPPHAANHPLAGLELEIEAEVLDHKRPELPAIDDALAKAYDFDDEQEFRDSVREDVRRYKGRERDRVIEDLALAQLMEKVDFDLPQELIEQEAEEVARRAAYEMQLQKLSKEEIAKRIVEAKTKGAEHSARQLKAYFLLDKVVEKERILVTENEVREAVKVLAYQNGKQPDEMYVMLREAGRLSGLRAQLRERKAREKLRKRAKVTEEVTGEEADATAGAEKKSSGTKKKTAKKPKE